MRTCSAGSSIVSLLTVIMCELAQKLTDIILVRSTFAHRALDRHNTNVCIVKLHKVYKQDLVFGTNSKEGGCGVVVHHPESIPGTMDREDTHGCDESDRLTITS